ncbi:hypothetical protein Pfo_000013 [Paulownia fortunei]|nr:hypothetical protein Pfo_000013 [Paulownia fortunei]
MTRQIMLRAPASVVDRRQPLLDNSDYSSRGGRRKVRLAEVAGGTTAECAAVCCCCPCGLVNLLVLAVYKVPAGLCRKALRRKRHLRLMKKGLLPPRKCGCDEKEVQVHPVTSPLAMVNAMESVSDNKEVIELEKEMWDKFYGAGFWRSPSQRSGEISAQ